MTKQTQNTCAPVITLYTSNQAGQTAKQPEKHMGAAATQRGNKVIRQQIDADYPQRPVEFELIDRLNSLEKYPDCGQPWGDLVISFSNSSNLWWVMCAKKRERGFGYCYKTLTESVKRWNVEIHGIEGEYYIARPLPKKPMSFDDFCKIRGIKF